ncbi:ABC transporter permease [Chryseolinea sp. T2]|uniref:ABC transporter permease n=1 Tax=Chryseolinea sp. T2 TaxID=3129255 RepID=UPI00307749F6
MFRNYFKFAIRHAARQKGFAFINIAGLSIGLVCSFFILVWVEDELSYDGFHKDGDRIYQLWRHMITDGQIDTWPSLGQPVAETIQAEYPEVETITWAMLSEQFVVTTGDDNFRHKGGYVSPAFFEVFSFPFLMGDPHTALNDVTSAVITEHMASALFGDDWQSRNDIIGRVITIDHRKDFTIKGILSNPPENSSLQFDVLLPAKDFTDRLGIADEWYFMCFSIYMKLHEGSSMENFNAKVSDHFIRHDEGEGTKLFLQPFEDVYLHSTYRDGHLVGGQIDYVRIFSVVAVFILLLACINFMNLATARSARRAREIGVRKVVGAQRRMLITQFVAESIAMTSASFVLALGTMFLLKPLFNGLTGKHFAIDDFNVAGMFLISLIVGIVAGSYPAFYLSSFNPVAALKSFRQRQGYITIRKTLVVFQFAISVTMIVATIGVFLQLDHMRSVNLGLQREGLLYLPREGALQDRYEAAVQELMKRPGIESVTSSGQDPLKVMNNTTGVGWPGKTPGSHPIFFIINASHDYVRTIGMELAAGRDFSQAFNDSASYIVNEEAAALMGGDILGTKIKVYGDEGQVVGVVKNFSMNSLRSPVEPTIIRFHPPSSGRIFVRTKQGQIPEAIASLKGVCEQFNPGYPFEYTFLDQVFEQTYKSEEVMGKLANIFAAVSIFISCLGLLGLTAFTVEQRSKEVGIRKVLGASVTGIAALLSADFVKLVLLGVLIALPVAGYFMREWLHDFSSRINMPWWLFATAGIAALVFAVVTIGFQSIKAALINPVETLRND